MTSVKKCTIENSFRSDHSPVSLSLCFTEFVKGKPLWKFNNSLLKDIQYIKAINKKIDEVKKQYSLPVYNFENLHNIPENEIQLFINDQLFLDTLLMEIRGQTISYSSFKKKQNDKKEMQLADGILKLEQNLTDDKTQELEKLKLELTELRQINVKGAVIRSRATNLLEGKKHTKYICALETHNYLSKIIPKLETSDGRILIDQHDILKESENFYKNLFSNKDDPLAETNLTEYLKNVNLPKLTDNESNQLEGYITLSELPKALSNMTNNKSPGTDDTKWIKSCLLSSFGTFKMPILMFISILVFRPEDQIWSPVRRDTKINVRRILNASRISKTQLNSSTISTS